MNSTKSDIDNNGTAPKDSEPSDEMDTEPKVRDWSAMRVSQDFINSPKVKKDTLTVPVRKPQKHEFVRVHPDSQFHFEPVLLYEDPKKRSDIYFVAPSLSDVLEDHARPYTLYPTVNRYEAFFLWPVRLPMAGSDLISWHESARACAQVAMERWCRMTSDQSIGGYKVHYPEVDDMEPDWAEFLARGMDKTLDIAFRRKIIDSYDHALVQQLRGRV